MSGYSFPLELAYCLNLVSFQFGTWKMKSINELDLQHGVAQVLKQTCDGLLA